MPPENPSKSTETESQNRLDFTQTPNHFFVEEVLAYEPEGTGEHLFARCKKIDMSTRDLMRRISEQTGVPLSQMRKAGMKDRAATATQWLSWPASAQKQTPVGGDHWQILETKHHPHGLSVGHILCNRFTLHLDASIKDLSQLDRALESSVCFPNFFGPQRFGREGITTAEALARLGKPVRDPMAVSVIQARLFNQFAADRLESHGNEHLLGDLFTPPGGKRAFFAIDEESFWDRVEKGDFQPSGPIFGYKMKLPRHDLETRFMAQYNFTLEDFRPWGKWAKGARRPLSARAEDLSWDLLDNKLIITLTLPSGSYATMWLCNLLQPGFYKKDMATWPSFTATRC